MPEQRLRFSKTGTARFISHLDLMRTFQRSFVRAGLHVKHTEGFNPHAYVSILLPLSVGYSSQCELLECGIPEGEDYETIPGRLTAALPEGITVTRCYDAVTKAKDLEWVDYIITLEYNAGSPVGGENTVKALLGQDSLVVTKASKKAKSGQIEVDLIPLIRRVSYETRRDALVLDATLKAQNPGLNPGLIVSAISQRCPELKPDYVSYHRKEIYDKNGKVFA